MAIGLQWIRGHCGVDGNEHADQSDTEVTTPAPNPSFDYTGMAPQGKVPTSSIR